ncbi:MAG: hypothetical protein R6X13_11255 [bacterium]
MRYVTLGLALLIVTALVAGCGGGKATAKADAYGKAIPADMAVTGARTILDDPAAFDGKDVLVAGKITSECPSGGWIWVQDSTAQIYVNMHPTNVFIPQRAGGTVRAMGKVVLESGQPQVVGYGLELK